MSTHTGELGKYVEDNGNTLDYRQSLRMIRGILEGLSYLESLGIIHRDIKFQNIVLRYSDGSFSPVIIDFGFAMKAKEGSPDAKKYGTLGYYAPEVLSHQGFDCRADVYSAGIVLFNMYHVCYR